jgi:hypothetical protein
MDLTFQEQLFEAPGHLAAKALLHQLDHVPRHPSTKSYPAVESVWKWASNNLPEEFAEATLQYVTKVCGANTWRESEATDHLKSKYRASEVFELGRLRQLPVPTLSGDEGRSMTIMQELYPERFVDWGVWKISGHGERPRSRIVALDDCIHTGNTIIRQLERWRQVTSPQPIFKVHIIALSAHEEGLSNIQTWAKQHGGEIPEDQLVIGRTIPRFGVRDGLRFPWSLMPESDFEKAALSVPEINDYIKSRRQQQKSAENFTEDQFQSAQPHADDVVGAVGLLLYCVRAYKLGLAQWNKTGGIRPMGYVDEKDPLMLHHELGFGSPFTSWFGVPNTAPLGLWTKVNAPSLFTRKGKTGSLQDSTPRENTAPSDLDDLPF